MHKRNLIAKDVFVITPNICKSLPTLCSFFLTQLKVLKVYLPKFAIISINIEISNQIFNI